LTDFNPSTSSGQAKIKNYPDVGMWDFDKIIDVCKKEKIDLVDVAQDDIIAAGYADKFNKLGITAFGPTQKASQIEWDKEWARNFMKKYQLPIPKFRTFSNKKEAIRYVEAIPAQVLYVKASGLAAGKGAIRAENKKQAIEAIESMSGFGKSGETFLIEEAMTGEEFSLFAICDGENYKIVSWAQDHKTVYDGDRGPNTGGMGCVAPTTAVDVSIIRIIETEILLPFMKGMRKEGRPYAGILYLGGMINNKRVKIIEFNARWGDPEAEVILPGIKTDFLDIVEAVQSGKLKKLKVELDKKIRISIAGCSRGYPDDYLKVKGKEIFGLPKAMKLPGITIFGAGIKRKGKRFFVSGGRIFHLVAEGKDISEARKKAYKAMKLINIEGNNLHYRKDIGWRDLERLQK
ncbi:phosphoribosylamine--glycine ligase, partial [Candidatus Daviesbacteria bacterium]|nr:phosphoribosylamine--glycine ligase [Candidatus Daviesbacteria bacterium]